MEDKLDPVEVFESRLSELLAERGITGKEAYRFIGDTIEARQALINSAVRQGELNALVNIKHDIVMQVVPDYTRPPQKLLTYDELIDKRIAELKGTIEQ